MSDADPASVLVTVDQTRCTGHGRCASAAGDIYDLDSDGYCAVTSLRIDPSLRAKAELGEQACPEGAITVS
jgi:ferredoxin